MGEPGHEPLARSAVEVQPALLVRTKLHPPVARPLVARDRLVEVLRVRRDAKLALLCAPAGWGKSSLLATWATIDHENRSFAWFAIDDADNDPVRFWTYVIEALRTVEPSIGSVSLAVLHAPGTGLTDVVLPELINEIATAGSSVILALDDYHLIKKPEIHASLAFLIEHLPPVLTLAIATRTEPCLPVAKLRARGELVEIDAACLGFSAEEADRFLNELLNLGLAPADVRSLRDRTEGWAAGLYLAALSLRDRADRREFIAQFAGDDRHIVDYLGAEVLARQDRDLCTFLLRTSILERLCTALCDAVTGTRNSGGVLREMERSNLFLVPLDSKRMWYRYHQLFRDLLRHDLKATEADLIPDLHRRAAQWLLDAEHISEGIHHTILAGDHQRACELIATHWVRVLSVGDCGTIDSWLEALPDDALLDDARVCVAGAFVSVATGRLEEAERWLTKAQRANVAESFIDGLGPVTAATRYLSAGIRLSIGALTEARTLALDVTDLLVEVSQYRQMVFATLGISSYLLGHIQEGLDALEEGLKQGRDANLVLAHIGTGGWLANIRADLCQWDEADELAAQALARGAETGAEEHWSYGLALCVRGRVFARRGQTDQADADLSRSTQLLRRGIPPFLAYALPIVASFKNAHGKRDEARQLIREARSLVATFPDPGILPRLIEETARRLRVVSPGPTAPCGEELSARELAVLRLLPTTLSQREIAGRLCVSMNTVKSHVKSIFRKFAVSTREEAVAAGRAQGLI